MNVGLVLALGLAFLAGALLFEGIYLLWIQHAGLEAQSLQRRLRVLSGEFREEQALKLLRRSAQDQGSWLERLLTRMPRIENLQQMINQAGSTMTVSRFTMLSLLLAGTTAMLTGLVLRPPVWFGIGATLLLGLSPYIWISGKRRKRLQRIEMGLPDAVDLISRAMRAGHAFPTALQLVGAEMVGPTAGEFRSCSEEITFGVPVESALQNLAKRAPSDDVRFFVIAVLLQRETGGNLAELLRNISSLIRERMHLMGKVKVLSAEGKLSAYVLVGLPFSVALVMNLANPKFMSPLWTDPAGIKLIYACVMLMTVGVFWMWRIIKIRV